MRVIKKDEQIYLAGPFFNPPQKDAAELIANLCVSHCQKYFSPLLSGGGPLKSPEHAAEVFASNVREIRRSKVVLAQLEWLMPPNREIRVVGISSMVKIPPTLESPPLNIPDSGTVWEVGYAACLRDSSQLETFVNGAPRFEKTPLVIAYTTAPQSKLNLMLARSCDAYLNGWDAVHEFIHTGVIPDDARTFKGKEQ